MLLALVARLGGVMIRSLLLVLLTMLVIVALVVFFRSELVLGSGLQGYFVSSASRWCYGCSHYGGGGRLSIVRAYWSSGIVLVTVLRGAVLAWRAAF